MSDAAAIADALNRYSDGIAAQLQAGREHLSVHFPRGYELVYDNYNALGFGFAFADRAADVVVSIVGYPRWVTLFFLYGVNLADPERLLQGSGSRVRSVRLVPSCKLQTAPVQALLEATKAHYALQFEAAPALSTIVKLQTRKQRPRMPANSDLPLSRRNRLRDGA